MKNMREGLDRYNNGLSQIQKITFELMIQSRYKMRNMRYFTKKLH